MATFRELLLEYGGKKQIATLRENNGKESDLEILKETFRDLQKNGCNGEPSFAIFNTRFQEYVDIDESTKIPDGSRISITITYKLDVNISVTGNSPMKIPQIDTSTVSKYPKPNLNLSCDMNNIAVIMPVANTQNEICQSPVATTSRKGLPYPPPLPQLSPAVQTAWKNGHLLESQQHFIRDCATHLSSLVPYPTKKDYANYCSSLIRAYPELGDTDCEIPYQSVKLQISKVIRNSRYYDKNRKSSLTKSSTVVSITNNNKPSILTSLDNENEEEMNRLLEKPALQASDVLHLTELLGDTFLSRRKKIKEGINVLEAYPALKYYKYATLEFDKITTTTKLDRQVAFLSLIEKIRSLADEDIKDSDISLLLWAHKMSSRQIKKTDKPMIELKKVGDKIDDTCSPFQAPCLLLYMDGTTIISAYVMGNGGALLIMDEDISTFTVMDALLATYYIHDLSYPLAYQGLLLILQCFMLNAALSREELKNIRLAKFLKKLNK